MLFYFNWLNYAFPSCSPIIRHGDRDVEMILAFFSWFYEKISLQEQYGVPFVLKLWSHAHFLCQMKRFMSTLNCTPARTGRPSTSVTSQITRQVIFVSVYFWFCMLSLCVTWLLVFTSILIITLAGSIAKTTQHSQMKGSKMMFCQMFVWNRQRRCKPDFSRTS